MKLQNVDTTEGVIWKQLLRFFFPILLGTFFQQLYNTVDAVIVGQFVGKEALAAVGGATGHIINLLVGFFVGLSSGASVVVSQYFGAKKADDTNKAVHTAIALATMGGIFLMVSGLILSPWALRMMNTPVEIIDYAVLYMRIYFGGIVFSLVYNMGAGVLRAVGDSKRPLYYLIISALTNLVLDLVFVLYLKMGVAGVALATVISQVLSAILVMRALMRTDDTYKVVLKNIRPNVSVLRKIIRIGFPAGCQSLMYSVSNLIIQEGINEFGTDTVAAWTAYGKFDGLFWMIMSAFGISMMTFAGQNYGAQKYDRIHRAIKIILLMAFGLSVVMGTVYYFFGSGMYQLFTKDSEVIIKGTQIMKTLAPFYFTYVCIEVFSSTMRGVGDAVEPMIITCLGICVLRVAWIFTIVPRIGTLPSLLACYPITWSVTSLVFVVFYKSGKWIKNTNR